MTSIVSICNQALDEIAKNNISDLEEASAEAVKCSEHYHNVRKSVLSAYPWKFARKVEAMASLPVAKWHQSLWLFVYLTPKDCLKVRRIIPTIEMPEDYVGPDFDITGQFIYTNDPAGFLEYTYDHKNEALFPQLFVDALAMALAARICMPLTSNLQVKMAIAQMAAKSFTAATVWDANSIHETSDHTSEMITVRQ
jgi:hypothetical protein